MIFEPGKTVRTEASGQICGIEKYLGGGGQGEVYRAQLAGNAVALKWYLPHAATPQQRERLRAIVKKGPPAPNFLWPTELAVTNGVEGFGYVMPLREPRFRGVVSLMRRELDPTFRALATAAFELANSFLQLHSRGFCYRDISFGNVFFDPATGETLICDNDNVAVDGASAGSVLGTPRFMAPEVVLRQALPSTQTDLYSLAVLLFYIFFMHHPLEGRRESTIHSLDLAAMTRLFGAEPLFIFDPADESNRPVPGLHDNPLTFWPLYPRFFRALFTRAFTEGLRDPSGGRVREGEWRAAAVRLRDAIYYCGCGAENFYDPGAEAETCWSCGRALILPFRIKFSRHLVMLNHDAQLFPHHIDDQRLYDFSEPVAAVTQNPHQPGVWGLTNLSAEPWSFNRANDFTPRLVEPGRSLPLAPGTQINFGRAQGEIVY